MSGRFHARRIERFRTDGSLQATEFDKPPYLVTETGWGEFTINIRVQFVAEASEKPLNLSHSLKLHHWGAPIDAPPPPLPLADSPATQPTAASSAITPAPATAAASSPVPEEKAGSADARPEAQTDVSQEKQEIEVAVGKGEAEAEAEVKTETAVSTPAPGDSITAVRAGDDAANNESMITHHLNSVAARLPVHAWQYDELVFSDPPSAFLEIMNEHPPTPLPAKFRRPRDQREKEEGSKKKKGRLSVSAVVSRAQTQEPGDSGTPAPVTPIGIHGEPGSADVPLEFAKEMEVGETNRLMDVKVSIIDQMDKLRYVQSAQDVSDHMADVAEPA